MALIREWVEAKLANCNAASAYPDDADVRAESAKWAELCRHWLATQWQPIETAPKDGARVMLTVRGYTGGLNADERRHWFPNLETEIYHIAYWHDGTWYPFVPNQWTHWMPLPEPTATNPEEST